MQTRHFRLTNFPTLASINTNKKISHPEPVTEAITLLLPVYLKYKGKLRVQLEENGEGWKMKIGLDCWDEVLHLDDEVASLKVGVGIAFGTNRTKCWPRLTTRLTSAFSINRTGIDDVTTDSPISPASFEGSAVGIAEAMVANAAPQQRRGWNGRRTFCL